MGTVRGSAVNFGRTTSTTASAQYHPAPLRQSCTGSALSSTSRPCRLPASGQGVRDRGAELGGRERLLQMEEWAVPERCVLAQEAHADDGQPRRLGA
jgi:hypothetical protein